MSTVAARLAVAALGAVAIGAGAHALRADHGCARVKDRARTAPAGALGAIAVDAIRRCGDPRDRAGVALVLLTRDRTADAVGIVRRMTHTTPDDYVGWLSLWRLTGDRAALAAAHTLNPRATPAP